MDHRVRTGDVLLFSNNTPTGFLLRTFISSEWNHTGIAVRFKEVNHRKIISLDDEGELYVLETNSGLRTDEIFGINIAGAGFSRAEMIFPNYNRIAVRKLHDVFRTPELADLTMKFARENQGNLFPTSVSPFFSVWLGVSFQEKDPQNTDMFCSELMTHYYHYVMSPMYERLTGTSVDGKLGRLFGTGSPHTENMFTPGHYASNRTPNSSIFVGSEELIYVAHADILYVLLQPFLIIVVIMLAIWMALPH